MIITLPPDEATGEDWDDWCAKTWPAVADVDEEAELLGLALLTRLEAAPLT